MKNQNLLLRLRSRTQRNVAALLRRSLSLFLLVGHPRLVARRGGRLFLLGSIAGQAQRTSLRLAVGNLGGVWRGRSLSVHYRPFGFKLLGFLGALAEARLLCWPGAGLQRIYRLHAGTRRLRPRASARVFRLALRCAGQGLGRRLAQANLFLLPRVHRCLLGCSSLLALLCRLCRCWRWCWCWLRGCRGQGFL